jgi:hypothetical protein
MGSQFARGLSSLFSHLYQSFRIMLVLKWLQLGSHLGQLDLSLAGSLGVSVVNYTIAYF